MKGRKPSAATVVALLALVVALGGTAIAADHYIITSSSQIKPSVLRELRASAHVSSTKPATRGAHSIVARSRSVGPVTAVKEPAEASDPLSGGTWTQHPEEIDEIVGQVTFTDPTGTECVSSVPRLHVFLDGTEIGSLGVNGSGNTQTQWLIWKGPFASSYRLFEPGITVSHGLTVKGIIDGCAGPGHITINSVSIDVIADR